MHFALSGGPSSPWPRLPLGRPPLLSVFLWSPVVTADTLWACGLRWPFVCSSLTYCPTALVVTQPNPDSNQPQSWQTKSAARSSDCQSTRRIRNLHLTWPGTETWAGPGTGLGIFNCISLITICEMKKEATKKIDYGWRRSLDSRFVKVNKMVNTAMVL